MYLDWTYRPYSSGTCPNCGHCPCCGRSNQSYPAWWQGQPYTGGWPHSTTTAESLTVGEGVAPLTYDPGKLKELQKLVADRTEVA